jgi:hypothetical protein
VDCCIQPSGKDTTALEAAKSFHLRSEMSGSAKVNGVPL